LKCCCGKGENIKFMKFQESFDSDIILLLLLLHHDNVIFMCVLNLILMHTSGKVKYEILIPEIPCFPEMIL